MSNQDIYPPDDNGEDEVPDWLEKLQTGSLAGGAADEEPEAEIPDTESLPDWLNAPAYEDEAASSPASEETAEPEEVPEWLAVIREAEGTAEPEPEEKSEEPPDWLGAIPADEPETEKDEPESDLSERIQELKAQDPDVFPEEDERDENPDWMAGLGISEKEDEDPAFSRQFMDSGPAADLPAADDNTPDWMAGLGESSGLPGLSADDTGEDTPDWMQTVQPDEDQAGAIEAGVTDEMIAEAGSVDEVFPDLPGESGQGIENVEEWLRAVDTGSLSSEHLKEEEEETQAESYQQALSFSADEEFSFDNEELPSWLSEITPEAVEIEPEEEGYEPPIETPTAPAFQAELPPDLEEGISPAELPSWLQAMRPVGAVTPAEIITGGRIEGDEESIGPLAGLRGVLPAEPHIVQFGGESRARSSRLRILDRESGHAAILKNIVTNEDRAVQLKPESLPASQYLVRLGIGLAVYGVVLLGMLLGFNRAAYPDVFIENAASNQVRQIHNLINSELPEGSPVLVAFEYEAGLSGEMAGTAAPLVDNLIISGHPLVLVSTSPTGPAVAETFLQANLSKHDYITQQDYRNLGYLSGQQAGLLRFASAPTQAMPLYFNDGSSWWVYPPLATIRHIRDFGAVVVLSDDAEKARAWIEQVQPEMVDPNNPANSTPLILVVSAQAETLLRPYTQTRPVQVYGLIAGLKGGAYYDSLLPVSNVVRKYWDGYGAGLTVGFAVILLSSSVGFAGGLIRMRAERKEQA
jgi:hypothetical protein